MLLALSYAGLIVSHLPVALLVSATVLPAYLLVRIRTPTMLLRAAAGGLLGLGLAAIYLLPALTLQGWIAAEKFWSRSYSVDYWYLLAFDRWPDPDFMNIVTSFAAAWAVLAAGICLFFRKRGDAFFWAAVALVCVVLMTGLVPWFWQLPELGKVQFPWRLMVVVDFAIVTAVCHMRPTLQRARSISLSWLLPRRLPACRLLSSPFSTASTTRCGTAPPSGKMRRSTNPTASCKPTKRPITRSASIR